MEYAVLILESNLSGYGYSAIRYLKELGYRTVFMSRDVGEYRNSVTNPTDVADEVALVDTYDIGKILDFVHGYGRKIVACLAFDDFRVLQSSIVNQYLGNGVHPSVPALLACRFKSVLRQKLAGTRDGLRHIVFNEATAQAAIDEPPFGFPCVVKPVDENGSVAVCICECREDMREAVSDILTLPAVNSRGYSSSRKFIVEEYIGGDEFSAEMVWDAQTDAWRILGITKKFITPPPRCVELAHIFPHQFEADVEEEVSRGLFAVMSAIDLRNTFAHVEFKVKNGRFHVIEVNPRPGGDMIAELMTLARGYDPIRMMVRANLNLPLGDEGVPTRNGYAGIGFVADDQPGHVSRITLHDDEFVWQKSFGLPREIQGLRNSDDRLGYAVYANQDGTYIRRKVDGFINRELFSIDRSV
ncbi:ATP-grasp domain-containing protein [Burkholderia sp. WSM2232]|uniref:ATP-grasp domain-containing protein n=1 Tax=Burkholderia sp. WSM2232 TaxID=944436 RepID=UPI0018DD8089|nr:ATP-grasp domain-containing protein [Burkholderia sp. WSM2232]